MPGGRRQPSQLPPQRYDVDPDIRVENGSMAVVRDRDTGSTASIFSRNRRPDPSSLSWEGTDGKGNPLSREAAVRLVQDGALEYHTRRAAEREVE